ncbi:hypothetical protein TIFTF001_026819 [Ficus carica]|uniref:Uncharacterized protein n=1 Tax=Ficus carica TaxID=3494 RepID=A0AA88IU38_FICCA|nr:hypothetical protein TIFTF001_026819 [Ficus carica]
MVIGGAATSDASPNATASKKSSSEVNGVWAEESVHAVGRRRLSKSSKDPSPVGDHPWPAHALVAIRNSFASTPIAELLGLFCARRRWPLWTRPSVVGLAGVPTDSLFLFLSFQFWWAEKREGKRERGEERERRRKREGGGGIPVGGEVGGGGPGVGGRGRGDWGRGVGRGGLPGVREWEAGAGWGWPGLGPVVGGDGGGSLMSGVGCRRPSPATEKTLGGKGNMR